MWKNLKLSFLGAWWKVQICMYFGDQDARSPNILKSSKKFNMQWVKWLSKLFKFFMILTVLWRPIFEPSSIIRFHFWSNFGLYLWPRKLSFRGLVWGPNMRCEKMFLFFVILLTKIMGKCFVLYEFISKYLYVLRILPHFFVV